MIICCVSCNDSVDLEKPSTTLSNRETYIQLEQQLKNDLRLVSSITATHLHTNSPEHFETFEEKSDRTLYSIQYGDVVDQTLADEVLDLEFSPVNGGPSTPVNGGGGVSEPIKGDDAVRMSDEIFKSVKPFIIHSRGQVRGVENISTIVETASSYEDCVAALTARFDEVYNDKSLDAEDKSYILSYITAFKAVLAYADEIISTDPSVVSGRIQCWSSSRGQHIAGITITPITSGVSHPISVVVHP